jgi:hypothetical protein
MYIIITFDNSVKCCDITHINTIDKHYHSIIYKLNTSDSNWNPLIQISISTICNNGTNEYTLSNKYSLFDVKTIKKFNLPITIEYINLVCAFGKVDTLDYLSKKLNNFPYDEWALHWASLNGYVNVLEWWFTSGLELKYTEYALNWASQNGQVNVLEWWLKSGLELKYTEYALNWASESGYVNVLEWWHKSGLELKYTENALLWTSWNGHVNVLDWWLRSGLKLKYTESASKMASKYGISFIREL